MKKKSKFFDFFSGCGEQAKALKRLGAKFSSVSIMIMTLGQTFQANNPDAIFF